MKIINYDLHGMRCKVWNATTDIRVVFEKKAFIFFRLITVWNPIYKGAYIFQMSDRDEPKDGRPRAPSSNMSIGYTTYQCEHVFKNFDLKKRIAEIANEIIEEQLTDDKISRDNKKQIEEL